MKKIKITWDCETVKEGYEMMADYKKGAYYDSRVMEFINKLKDIKILDADGDEADYSYNEAIDNCIEIAKKVFKM